jgi:hypothetical protein
MARPFSTRFQIKPGHRVLLIAEPPEAASLFSELPDGPVLGSAADAKGCDVVFLFARSLAELDATLGSAMNALSDKGELWVARYKKASRVETDVLEPPVRERGRLAGLEDVMVRAVGPNWSALKFRRSANAAKRGQCPHRFRSSPESSTKRMRTSESGH